VGDRPSGSTSMPSTTDMGATVINRPVDNKDWFA